jgi:Flp pilus assembly protein TadG
MRRCSFIASACANRPVSCLRGGIARLIGDENGIAVVEAAVTFPFLAMLSFGLIEFGSIFYNFQLVQTGLRDAGRYLSRVPDLAAAEGDARRLATTGSILPDQPARVKWWSGGQVQISYRSVANPRDATTGLRNFRAGDTVTVVDVSTSVAYAGLGFLSSLGLGPITITAKHEERYIGQ